MSENWKEKIIWESQTAEKKRLPYPWYYEKKWYDVKAKDWTVFLWVRPNAGKFQKDDIVILEEDVVEYRLHSTGNLLHS